MYSIEGSITGLDASMFVRLNMNGGNFVTIEGSECPTGCSWAFSDEFVKYTEYDVQVSKHPVSEDETENQRCYVTNGEGTLTGPVNDVVVTCIDAHPVTGTVVQHAGGSSMQLQAIYMNGSAAEIISVDIEGNGNFEFKEPIAPTSDIDAFGNDVCLRIKQYPSSPSQLCCIRTSAAVPAQFSWELLGSAVARDVFGRCGAWVTKVVIQEHVRTILAPVVKVIMRLTTATQNSPYILSKMFVRISLTAQRTSM